MNLLNYFEKNSKFFTLFLLSLFLVTPIIIFAQGAGGLVPCDGPGKGATTTPSNYEVCDYTDFILLIQKLINFFILIAGSIAAILFAYAGFLYMTAQDNKGRIDRAKGIFRKVIIGIIVILAAWLIVNTLVNLLGVDQDYVSI